MLTFNDIFEQDAAIMRLRQAFLADRLPHGLIFAGPTGVGKAMTARALAGLFLCEKPAGDLPCGQCESCRAMTGDAHPDYHVITKELIRYHDKSGESKAISLAIDVIRQEVVNKATRKAVMGRGKVFVIEQAELMTPQAQNALLKTLEEPSGRTLLVLLTDQLGVMLPTIRSRCQMVAFANLDSAVVLRELEKRGVSTSDAADAVRFAGGSLGMALRWIEDGVIGPARELVRQVDDIFAGRPAGDLADWFKTATDTYAEKQLQRDELGSKPQATRDGLMLYLRLAADHIRAKLAMDAEADELERACSAIDAIARAEQYVDANVNIPLIFQQLTMALEARD